MQTLDVALGLVFVYLMLSLVCTAANELLSQWFNSRATTLKAGIDALLRNVTDKVDAKAITALAQAEAAAHSAYTQLESRARESADAAVTAWLAAVHEAEDATLSHEELCAQTRSETATTAARTRRDTALLSRASAEAALNSVWPGLAAQLNDARQRVAHTRADLTLASFYEHPLIAGLSQLPWRLLPWDDKVRIPSYIPTQTFVLALVDTVAPSSSGSATPLLEVRRAIAQFPEHVRRPLLLALNEAQGDVNAFRTHIATWFDSTMERVSGLYKRKTKLTVLMFAVLVTLFTNADTIRIVRALSSNRVLREALVAQAEATVRAPDPLRQQLTADTSAAAAAERADFAQSIANVQRLGIPIGYDVPPNVRTIIEAADWFTSRTAGTGERRVEIPPKLQLYAELYVPQVLKGAVGLLLTALALSLGAPFWFDILNKIVNVRAVGRTPAENAKVAASQAAGR